MLACLSFRLLEAGSNEITGAALAGRAGQASLERVVGEVANGSERTRDVAGQLCGLGAALRLGGRPGDQAEQH